MKHCCQYGQSKWHRDPLPDLIDDGGGGGGGGGKKKSFWSFLSPPVLGMTARGGAAVPMTAKTQAMTPTVGKEEGRIIWRIVWMLRVTRGLITKISYEWRLKKRQQ